MPTKLRKTTPDAYVHNSALPSADFITAFLRSPEFQDGTLRRLVPNHRKGTKKSRMKKTELARALTDDLQGNRVELPEVLLAWTRQPRRWLCFMVGEHAQGDLSGEFKAAELLFEDFDKQVRGWFGPITDPDDSTRVYFVKPIWLNNWEFSGPNSPPVYKPIRWHLFAEVGVGHVALTWNNFTRVERDQAVGREDEFVVRPFPYYRFVDPAFRELVDLLGGKWTFPNLSSLVLHTIWDRYVDDLDHNFVPKRVRSNARGVSLIARSAAEEEGTTGEGGVVEMQGLKVLSGALAEAALRGARVNPDATAMERAKTQVLRTMIHHWDPKAFEFMLNARPEDGKLRKRHKLCRAHCFFGNGARKKAREAAEEEAEKDTGDDLFLRTEADALMLPDALVHVECYRDYGFADGALEFFLNSLQIER